MPLPALIRQLLIEDNIIELKPYLTNDISLCNQFKLDEWHLMVSDFDSDKEWKKYLLEYQDYIQCYILFRKKDDKPIGFICFLQDDDKGKIVSIHGGGWHKTVECTFLYYRCFIYSIQVLLNLKLKVRTACSKNNIVAARFIKSVGFVSYTEDPTHNLFWINEKRLQRSSLYRRVFDDKNF